MTGPASAAPLARWRAGLGGLTGWRRYGLAVVLGGLATLAFAPFHLLPLLPVCLTALLWLLPPRRLRGRALRGALFTGWWFGLGHFAAGLYWITNALLIDPAQFGWLVPFAVLGLSAYFALFPAAALVAAAWAPAGWRRVAVLAAAWALLEVARGLLLTGFPWILMGSALEAAPALMQGAALIGVYGLSLIVVAAAAAPAVLADGPPGARALPVIASAVAFAGLWAGGALRIALAPDPGVDGPRLRIVQAAIDQRLKWRPEERRRIFETYVELSALGAGAGFSSGPRETPPFDAVIWPETAIPYVFDGGADYLRGLAQAAPPGGVLITGVVRAAGRGPDRELWNAIVAVDRSGRLAGRYDKHHLVPFGEYVPLRRFNPLPKLTEGRVDFSAGAGPATLDVPGLPPFSPLVCYEAIFPGNVVAENGAAQPRWLLNLTNDAWFGASTGPRQHLAAARLRAVEEGLPMIRAANTGVSAAFDGYGRERSRLELGVRGVLDVVLPTSVPGGTFFARFGQGPAFGLIVVFLLAGLWPARPQAQR